MTHAIRLSDNSMYLEKSDKVPFFYLADTWWYGMTSRMSWVIFKKAVAKRKKQGFTVIQIVVGIPPETDEFSKDAKNSGGHPFDANWNLNLGYFNEVDKKIEYLVKNNLVPCIVGNWGHHIDKIGIENMKHFWDEVIRRYEQYPVIFCLTGEADIFPNNFNMGTQHIPSTIKKVVRRFNFLLNKLKIKKRVTQWSQVAEYIKRVDTKNHLLTVHIQSQTSAARLFNNPKWLDINTIQSGHAEDRAAFMISTILNESRKSRPIIDFEPWYEGILDNFDDYWQRYAFWTCILSGAKGHSYGAHGLWQVSTSRDSFMGHWGKSDWQTALNYKGAEQLGLAKQFLERYEWWKLTTKLDIMYTHWSETDTNLPIAAEIENTSAFVYFPLKPSSKFVFKMKENLSGDKTWIDPSTMRSVKSPDASKTKDILLVIDMKHK